MEYKKVRSSNNTAQGKKRTSSPTEKKKSTSNVQTKKNKQVRKSQSSTAPKVKVKTKAKEVKKVKKENVKTVKDMKRTKKVKQVVITLFILAVIFTSAYLVFNLEVFNVKEIEFSGTEKYTSDQICNSLNLKKNSNIFYQYITYNKDNLSDFPYIENANVNMKFPDKLTVKVTERKSVYFAYDKEQNRFFRLSSNGYILEESDINSKTQDELLVFGIPFDTEVKFGTKINDISISNLNMYSNIKNVYDKSGINKSITKVNFENSLTTITLDDKLNVVLPNTTNLEYNITLLKTILENMSGDPVGGIDMTKNKPTFSSF